ncbi:hypothetical protein BRADI_3g40672v3 [Brachypodium distachyon]|uniref:Uncharacterized protein n=1 Tax=Brachypodium distachyon TaxID=15368 RepID=A0A2K2D2D3_BRADI|nr:hypothetical protein BRADI_3g40672v3 [Brachypodium distachyon]
MAPMDCVLLRSRSVGAAPGPAGDEARRRADPLLGRQGRREDGGEVARDAVVAEPPLRPRRRRPRPRGLPRRRRALGRRPQLALLRRRRPRLRLLRVRRRRRRRGRRLRLLLLLLRHGHRPQEFRVRRRRRLPRPEASSGAANSAGLDQDRESRRPGGGDLLGWGRRRDQERKRRIKSRRR